MMRPVHGLENFIMNAGPIYISGGYVLDGPCDLERLGAEIQTALDRAPNMSSNLRRIGPWHFWTRPEKIDVTERICVVEDPSLTGPEGLARIGEKARLLEPPRTAGDWRLTVVNPQGSAGAEAGSLLFLHFNHVIADALRMQKLLVGLDRHTAADARSDQIRWSDVRRYDADTFFSLPQGGERAVRLHMFSIDLEGIRAAGETGSSRETILRAIADVVVDSAMFPGRQERTPLLTCTFFTRKNTDRWQMGNFITGTRYEVPMASEDVAPGRLPELVQLGSLRASLRAQTIISLFPAAMLKKRIVEIQEHSDAWISIVPMGRARVRLGGRNVKAVFGVMPLFGDLPLTVGALSFGGKVHFTFTPGTKFKGNVVELARRFEERMTRKSQVPVAMKPSAPTS